VFIIEVVVDGIVLDVISLEKVVEVDSVFVVEPGKMLRRRKT
jgi:hypothetical protein